MEVADSLEQRVRALFRQACPGSKDQFEGSIEEIVEALRLEIQELLTCRRDRGIYEERCEQFEAMLQHLEGEVRKHIGVSGK